MSKPTSEMHIVAQRIATFQQPHQLSKRRASSQSKKKTANTIEWPHESPFPEALARAGFFYRPAHDSVDNVQCFFCTVKLDGWEPKDDPIREHLAHSKGCAWATTLSVERNEEDEREPEMRDPLSDEMVAARTATFTFGEGWPHEDKKGWKCKIAKLVSAGWSWDPAGEGDEGDGVTCFYCNLSLDGWEPTDDPFVEHQRREPACRFFQLLEHHHGPDTANGKLKKAKTRATGDTRGSTTAADRTSTQSAASEVLSVPGNFHDTMSGSLVGLDDSVLITSTTVSQATTSTAGASKGKKAPGKRKAAAGASKNSKKKSKISAEQPEMNEDFDNQNSESNSQIQAPQGSSSMATFDQVPVDENDEAAPPAKITRKGSRASKQVDSSSIFEISRIETAPPKKATRGRKPKAKHAKPDSPRAASTTAAAQRISEVSAQLQEELEHSVDNFSPTDESTPVADPPKAKRGVKRTSDGLRKQLEMESTMNKDVPPSPKTQPTAKEAQGRHRRNSAASIAPQSQVAESEDPLEFSKDDVAKAPALPAKKGKASSKAKKARSTHSSTAMVMVPGPEELSAVKAGDLARDELVIEKELERIAHEQMYGAEAMTVEHERADEFEPSPSHGRVSGDRAELRKLQDEIDAEDSRQIAQKDFASPPRHSPRRDAGITPSPNGSDKENQSSSLIHPSAKQQQQPPLPPPLRAFGLSPTKTIRIPLAASTPNRSLSKATHSPSKQISHLTSTVPWMAVDLDTVLLFSPQPSPGALGPQLVAATGGALTSPEKRMSVEEWVRYRAEQGEVELKRRCEEMVAAFEKEGMRGLETLQGIKVVG